MSEQDGWMTTQEAARLTGLRQVRSIAAQLGIELRSHPTRATGEVIHREDVELLIVAMVGARANRARRAGK